MRFLFLRTLAGAGLMMSLAAAHAAPPTPEQLAQLCASVEGPAHCGRMIEEAQMKSLPNLAKRDGDALTVTLFPSGQRVFTDSVTTTEEKSYALFDYWSPVNAVVLLVTNGDDSTFAILQRANGVVTDVPAEPILAPDRQRIAVADFCGKCPNELSVWRIDRQGIRRELAWTPAPAWTDATAKWKDADTLVLTYTPVGTTGARTVERKLTAADWTKP